MTKRTLFTILVLTLLCAAGLSIQATPKAKPAAPSALAGYSESDINAALQAAYTKYKDMKEGKNADYIPALAKVDSNIYGIALVTPDGKIYTAGDVKSEVSIQSISKVFTMAKVFEEQGPGQFRAPSAWMPRECGSTPSSPSKSPRRCWVGPR